MIPDSDTVRDEGARASSGRLDRATLASRLESANIPSLLMVLYQLTGEHRWLESPYAPIPPEPGTVLDDTDGGGLPREVQAEIRAAAADAILAWDAGRAPAVPSPSGDVLTEMMSVCVAEPVPDEYSPMFAVQLGFDPMEDPRPTRPVPEGFSVLVIGAGISGLAMAYRLQIAGIPFRVLERASDVGGVWRDNHYPGAGVDTSNELYSFSFFPRDWSMYYSKRDEVYGYLRDVADHFGLRKYIEFGCEADRADYDEATQRWTVSYRDASGAAQTAEASVVVTATGIFSEPKIPPIPGLDSFRGPLFHSAEWPEDLDVTGRRLAVIGSGASAMQIVPATSGRAETVSVFQRTPSWIMPATKYFDTVPEGHHWLTRNIPWYREWSKFRMAWSGYDKLFPSIWIDPEWPHADRSINATNEQFRISLTQYIRTQLASRPDLIDKVTPDYPPFGKRMLLDNGWYQALLKENVELIDEEVVEILPDRVRSSSGLEREADVVVLATGFQTTRYLGAIRVHGRGGAELHEVWGDDNAEAYLGFMNPGFPNLFLTYGPNSQGAGGSFMASAEQQSRFIVRMISTIIDEGIGAVEPKQDVFDAYIAKIDELLGTSIWAHPRVTTYYKNRHGRVVVSRPWSVVDFWHMQRMPNLDDFALEPARTR